MTSSELNYTQEALALAQRVVYELTGRRVVWPALTTTELFTVYRRNSTLLRMSGTPVQSVVSVELLGADGESLGPIEFEQVNASRVRIKPTGYAVNSASSVWICPDRHRQIAVTYMYGAKPPADLQNGIEQLAAEYTLLLNGETPMHGGACSLPPNASSVSSRGISVSMEDEPDIVTEGRTGIDSLDSAITRYNNVKAATRARLISPTFPPTQRINTR